ncbi:disulfide bond formation protein DsbA [Pseudooceanicola lipolyticus]|uniref:Disulfide bond formation protein DsbA n=1 Tax=Pseudooceanicola lipolyticus TaxID=2029104 RepID=A0A2M8J1P3_9RHOB|nr:DsbA family oxidoreductase [Pseudooceanicola lipolyticus]PJE36710.1 disulfide bond formation protein DsbA [Pseudooceanicola lipolyticus]
MQPPPTPLQIDIVSDVVCPWCIIGFKQLEQAMGATGMGAYVRWHPFELNPQMPPEGQNLREHLAEKYGTTPEQSRTARQRLTDLGDSLGFTFHYSDDTRMVNTFAAHQLLDWAAEQNLQHPLKMALFAAFFTEGKDVSDHAVLAAAAGAVGLDPAQARSVLDSGSHAEQTRAKQRVWLERGISGVPAMVFAGKYLVTGAQGAEGYAEVLRRCAAEAA